MSCGVTAEINLAALRHNLQRVRSYAPKSAVMAMIKANAYGHGLLPVARALSSADAFGVARLDEALVLRRNQIKTPVVVMSGFTDIAELKEMAQQGIAAVIHTLQQVKLLETTKLPQPLPVWIKIDSGMHRLGIQPQQFLEVYRRLSACANVHPIIGLLTHFASADSVGSAYTDQQIEVFSQTTSTVPLAKSMAGSAAIMTRPNTHHDWVRPGIMLYGVSPFLNQVGSDFGLQPVMTLKSALIARHDLPQYATVGYSGTWICPEDMPIGVAAIGYGDGYPRHIQNGAPVLVNGQRCAIAGRVSMDLITIDLRNNPQAQIGDPVVLWGEGLPVEEIAASAETIGYELLCHAATGRVQYILKEFDI